ncbi:hypothetical protein Ancab_019264 [Ancistrocladus abbreviatus]
MDDLNHNGSKVNDLGGWSFLQALTNTSPISKGLKYEDEKGEYVHPMVKRSASALSEKSLEMCTESLGCETGSIISDSNDDFSNFSWDNERFQPPKSRDFGGGRRLGLRGSFPPPLTTMSGGVQMEGRRVDGRLVVMAVAKSLQTCFKAERRDGRLRLHYVNDNGGEGCEGDDGNGDLENEEEVDFGYDDDCEDDVDYDEEEEEEEEEEMDKEGCGGEDMEGISGNVGDKIDVEVGNFLSRPTRCKEGGSTKREMVPWKHFCVASS